MSRSPCAFPLRCLPALVALAVAILPAPAVFAQATDAAPAAPAAAAAPSAAATPRAVPIGVLTWRDDPRFNERQLERAYPGHSAGPGTDGAAVALKESRFPLKAAGVDTRLADLAVATQEEAAAAVRKAHADGMPALLVDLPSDWIGPLAKLADEQGGPVLINTTATDDTLRGAQCHAMLFHTYPSERMLSDALGQYLAMRKWRSVLVLQGPLPADVVLGEAFTATARKFGLKIVESRPFRMSNDPRERDLGNVALLTSNAEYDAVVVLDSDGEFARTVPYRTVKPRPVLGSNGLIASAWHPHHDRFGAPQLNRRFVKQAKRPMDSTDWGNWVAVKAVVTALIARPDLDAAGLRTALRDPELKVDGFKGRPLNFRPWDQQLRQPVFLSFSDYFTGIAPFDGFLHQTDVLDSLGIDQPESKCQLPK